MGFCKTALSEKRRKKQTKEEEDQRSKTSPPTPLPNLHARASIKATGRVWLSSRLEMFRDFVSVVLRARGWSLERALGCEVAGVRERLAQLTEASSCIVLNEVLHFISEVVLVP